MTKRVLPAVDINVTPLAAVSYGQVISGLDAVRGAGAERIGLILSL